MNEAEVKKQVKKILKAHGGVYYHMPVLMGYGTPSLDFICCVNGLFFAIETKAPGKKPTARQNLTIKEIEDAGGITFVIDGSPDSYDSLQRFLEACLDGEAFI